ncbi:MAG: tryptophan-rich sensory protein [Verrucomicrobia bacterium]|nr:tryptophan-rich sensory protein [Verrucomicrobiota bacterium]
MEPSLEDLARERRDRTSTRPVWRLCGLLFLCLAVAAVGSAATLPEIKGWYAGLIKPPFNPPNWAFGPVWSTLYVLMAWAASEAWADRPARRTFFIILLVNALWSLFFFGLHQPGLALIDIFAYLTLLVLWIRQLWPQHRSYALLQIPHLLWVSFATVLNASIWWLNQ